MKGGTTMSKSKCTNRVLLNMNTYHPDGSINEEELNRAAKRHFIMLCDFVPEETLQTMQQELEFFMSSENWNGVSMCLSAYLRIAAIWMERYIFCLSADEQLLQYYAKRISSMLKT